MIPGKSKILIVDESLENLRIHAATLRSQGYEAWCAHDGEEALRILDAGLPDLFLINSNLRNMNGYQLCRHFKQDSQLKKIPVIFITEDRSPANIDQGYAVGGVDYIVTPFHPAEFLARVATHVALYQLVQRVEQMQETAIDANPLTRLPGNNSIVRAIQEAIDQHRDVAIIHTDLDNFKAVNDAYGFSVGDDILLFNAEILHTALRKYCDGDSFLGHIGGDDFVVMIPADKLEVVANEVIRRFDDGAPSFYAEVDRKRRYLISVDRQGTTNRFPITSISMGGMLLRDYWFTRYVEVAEICGELKHAAKKYEGSNLFTDRREATRDRLNPLGEDAAADEPTLMVDN